jgi:hypothetical protein
VKPKTRGISSYDRERSKGMKKKSSCHKNVFFKSKKNCKLKLSMTIAIIIIMYELIEEQIGSIEIVDS